MKRWLAKALTGTTQQWMKVNADDLVIDLPVDESKVQELMVSIKAFGMRQPPQVWLNGMRIIDGFHRAVACQRLKIGEIDCQVDDCPEDAFWDSRIIAAKPHVSVNKERLGSWITESWKLTEWYKPIDADEIKKAYADFCTTFGKVPIRDDMVRFSAAQMVWNADFSVDYVSRLGGLRFQNELLPVERWFVEKAKRWGVSLYSIQSDLLLSLGFQIDPMLADLKKTLKIPLVEADVLSQQTKSIANHNDYKREWVRDFKSGETKKSVKDYIKEAKAKARQQKSEIEELKRSDEVKHKAWLQSPQGQAHTKSEKIAEIDKRLDSIFDAIENLDIDGAEQAPRRLTSLISAIESKIILAFPDHMKKSKVNPVIKENIELHKKIAEQERQIESLTRAVESKNRVSGRIPGVTAFSSSEIEAM